MSQGMAGDMQNLEFEMETRRLDAVAIVQRLADSRNDFGSRTPDGNWPLREQIQDAAGVVRVMMGD